MFKKLLLQSDTQEESTENFFQAVFFWITDFHFSAGIWSALSQRPFDNSQGCLCQGHLTPFSHFTCPPVSLHHPPVSQCSSHLQVDFPILPVSHLYPFRFWLFNKAPPCYFTPGSSPFIFWLSKSLDSESQNSKGQVKCKNRVPGQLMILGMAPAPSDTGFVQSHHGKQAGIGSFMSVQYISCRSDQTRTWLALNHFSALLLLISLPNAVFFILESY